MVDWAYSTNWLINQSLHPFHQPSATGQRTLTHGRLSSVSHCGLILDLKEWHWCTQANRYLKIKEKKRKETSKAGYDSSILPTWSPHARTRHLYIYIYISLSPLGNHITRLRSEFSRMHVGQFFFSPAGSVWEIVTRRNCPNNTNSFIGRDNVNQGLSDLNTVIKLASSTTFWRCTKLSYSAVGYFALMKFWPVLVLGL